MGLESPDSTTPTTSGPFSEFDERVRTYIVGTLAPFIPAGDKTGNLLLGFLRRMLKTAGHDDLQMVIRETKRFIDGMEEAGLVIDDDALIDEAARHLHALPGPGVVDRADSIGEVDDGEVSDKSLSHRPDGGSDDGEVTPEDGRTEGLVPPEDSHLGHETTLAGDSDVDGSVDPDVVSQDGPGG
jgi:hypothetical protein